MAVAAFFILVLILMMVDARRISDFFTGRRQYEKHAASPVANSSPANKPAITATVQNNDPANDDDDTEDISGSFNGYRNPVRRPVVAARTLKYTSVNIQPAYHEYPITVVNTSLPDDAETIRSNMNPLLMDNNYLVITSPNGESTRASLKIADALRYLYGDNGTEEAADKNNNENTHWKKRLQEWRNKIISSHFIPASTNFLDIIDLKDLIYEKP